MRALTRHTRAVLTVIAAVILAFWDKWMPLPLVLAFADVTDTFYSGEAFIGYKAQIKVGQGDSPETFVAVADMRIITPGSTPAGIINKTHLRSPGRTHEKLSTIRDLTAFQLAGNYRPGHGSHKLTPAGADGFAAGTSLTALHRSQAESNFEISVVDADGTTHTLPFRGVVSDYKVGQIVLDQLVDFTADIQPLSDWTASLP